MATEFDRAKVLDFHAAACADALQHYPELPAEVQQYLAAVQICEYPDISPMAGMHNDVFLMVLYHPVYALLMSGRHDTQMLLCAARSYIHIVTKEHYYEHMPREVSEDLMKYYDDL